MERCGIPGILEEDSGSGQSEEMGNITPAGVLRHLDKIISRYANANPAHGYPVGARTPALVVLAIEMSEIWNRRFSRARRRQKELSELKQRLDSDWNEMVQKATYDETLRSEWKKVVAKWQTH
jgi:hypothetical protein